VPHDPAGTIVLKLLAMPPAEDDRHLSYAGWSISADFMIIALAMASTTIPAMINTLFKLLDCYCYGLMQYNLYRGQAC
jgi:hypothetical protein